MSSSHLIMEIIYFIQLVLLISTLLFKMLSTKNLEEVLHTFKNNQKLFIKLILYLHCQQLLTISKLLFLFFLKNLIEKIEI